MAQLTFLKQYRTNDSTTADFEEIDLHQLLLHNRARRLWHSSPPSSNTAQMVSDAGTGAVSALRSLHLVTHATLPRGLAALLMPSGTTPSILCNCSHSPWTVRTGVMRASITSSHITFGTTGLAINHAKSCHQPGEAGDSL